MNGLMMDWPLIIPNILRRAGQFFPEKEIVSRRGDGVVYRSTYGEVQKRVHRLMNVLRNWVRSLATVSPPVPGIIKNTSSYTLPSLPSVRFCTRSIFGSRATNCSTSSIMHRTGSYFSINRWVEYSQISSASCLASRNLF